MNRKNRRIAVKRGKTPVAAATLKPHLNKLFPTARRMPDVVPNIRAADEKPSLPADADRLKSLLDQQTPEQRAIVACGQALANLYETQPEIKRIVTSMVTFRQAYAVTYREMQELLKSLGDSVPSELGDFCAQYGMHQAAQPFDESTVINSLISDVLPWLADVLDKHTKEQNAALAAERQTDEDAREARAIPLGFPIVPLQKEDTLERSRSLVLVGWRPAVLWLIDEICSHVLKQKQEAYTSILRLTAGDGEGSSDHYAKLPASTWKNCADSDLVLDRFIGEYVTKVCRGSIDLLVCDDLAQAYSRGFIGRAAGALAGDAHKRLRRWCTERLRAGLIGGVLLDDRGLQSLPTPAYEQLKTFTHLRGLAVEESPTADHWRLILGDHVAVFDVPKATLNAYSASSLLVPENL